MIRVVQTTEFRDWHEGLKDRLAAKKIAQRIVRLESGLFGDVKAVGEGLRELRIDFGPGYRIYFVQRGDVLLLLLLGGDKSTQDRDIAAAKALAKEY